MDRSIVTGLFQKELLFREKSYSFYIPAEAQNKKNEVDWIDAVGLGGGWRSAYVHGAES